jgi:hypothetical protein
MIRFYHLFTTQLKIYPRGTVANRFDKQATSRKERFYKPTYLGARFGLKQAISTEKLQTDTL